MQYLGGKARIAKPLAAYLRSRLENRYFVEPFCGALNVTAEMTGRRVASDASPYLFTLYSALRRGWVPPDVNTREEYERVANGPRDPADPLTAFVGYGCSWGGKWFGGYFQNRPEWVTRAANAQASLLRKFARCSEVVFACRDYRELNPGARHLVYCDPPYAGTTGYDAVGEFDTLAFWATVRAWAVRGALVLVSEYTAPPDFRCVWEMKTRTDLHGAGRAGRVEKLWEFNP
jgi:DNA adenine methylase